MNDTLIKDALYNLGLGSCASQEYKQGLVVGMISAFMAAGKTYAGAIDLIAKNLPATYGEYDLPKAYREDIVKARERYRLCG